jgi:ABC-type branched-subunit amino acid transport system permease subunit
MGRAMQAVRDDETAAASFGINLPRVKAGAFGLSAGLAGTAGALQVVLFPFVSHEQFTIFLSFRLYAAALLGGVSTIIGAVYGVMALVLIPAVNNALGLLDNDVLVFGIGLILLTFVSPDGIAGLVERATGRDEAGGNGQAGRLWRNVKGRYSG